MAKKASEVFVHLERSGAVTVDLDRFLKSPAGQKQLETIKLIRERKSHSARHSPGKRLVVSED